jgi:CheY-like chemotaxis protein
MVPARLAYENGKSASWSMMAWSEIGSMSLRCAAAIPTLEHRPGSDRADAGSERAFRLDGVRVLAVDDNERHLGLVRAVLEVCGASVHAANSATAALEMLRREPPDVLVADIVMQGHDGFWLMREVRQLPAESGGETPAVAITGLESSEDLERLKRAGFEYRVCKPIAPVHLAATVRLLARKTKKNSEGVSDGV